MLAKTGKDAADHVAAGHTLDDLVPGEVGDLVPDQERDLGQDEERADDEHALLGPRGAVVTLSTVTPERVTWVWPGRLPAGKLVVLDGDPSIGKSTMALDFAARVSTGATWPDGAGCDRGDVLILSAEDGLADTIRPRLDAAGGDPARVHALTGVTVTDDDGEPLVRPVTLADHAVIATTVRRYRVKLVIVDVLMALLPAGTDSHRDQDVRTVLARLHRIAEDTGCCILMLRHLNKTGGGNPLYRGGGSIGIVGAARAGYVAAVDPEDETRRVLACTKLNLAPMPTSLAYRLEPVYNGVARVQWCGQSDATAATVLATLGDDDERTERDEAAEWLVDYLSRNGGEAKAGDAIKAAGIDGIAKTTLTRGRQRAGVSSTKAGMHGGWVWSLDPRRIHEESEGTSSKELDSSVPSVDSSGRDLHHVGPPTSPIRGEVEVEDVGRGDLSRVSALLPFDPLLPLDRCPHHNQPLAPGIGCFECARRAATS